MIPCLGDTRRPPQLVDPNLMEFLPLRLSIAAYKDEKHRFVNFLTREVTICEFIHHSDEKNSCADQWDSC